MLIKCPDCGRMRSSDADFCPFCGCKRKSSGCLGGVIFLIVSLYIVFVEISDASKYFTTANVNYRNSPGGKVLGQIKKETEISCSDIKDGWCKTTWLSTEAYVSTKFLTKQKPEKATEKIKKTPENLKQDVGFIQAVEE